MIIMRTTMRRRKKKGVVEAVEIILNRFGPVG
jgi:hypothetical protein